MESFHFSRGISLKRTICSEWQRQRKMKKNWPTIFLYYRILNSRGLNFMSVSRTHAGSNINELEVVFKGFPWCLYHVDVNETQLQPGWVRLPHYGPKRSKWTWPSNDASQKSQKLWNEMVQAQLFSSNRWDPFPTRYDPMAEPVGGGSYPFLWRPSGQMGHKAKTTNHQLAFGYNVFLKLVVLIPK